MRNYDVAIIGAGCAGLALADALLTQGYTGRIVIIDAKSRFSNDRSWCGFSLDRFVPRRLIRHQWSQLVTRTHQHQHVVHVDQPYQMLFGQDYYDYRLTRLATEQVEIRLNETVISCSPVIVTDQQQYQTHYIIDTRPEQMLSQTVLKQHFYGLFCHFCDAELNTQQAILMDFRADEPDNHFCFIYCLPLGKQHALVELTYFSRQIHAQDQYQKIIERYIKSYLPTMKTVLRDEFGIIPMTTQQLTSHQTRKDIRLGLASGCARPATGYAFQTIHSAAQMTARAICNDSLPRFSNYATWQLAADKLFLNVVSRAPDQAVDIVMALFKKTPADRLVRFFNNQHSLLDMIKIGWHLPKTPFLRALF